MKIPGTAVPAPVTAARGTASAPAPVPAADRFVPSAAEPSPPRLADLQRVIGSEAAPALPDWRSVLLHQPVNQPFDLAKTDVHLGDLVGAAPIAVSWRDRTGPDAASQILMSDGPETMRDGDFPTGQGIADDNTLAPGVSRIVLDHVNALSDGKPRKLVMALEAGPRAVTVAIQRAGVGSDPLRCYQQFLDGGSRPFPQTLVVPPGQRRYLTIDGAFGAGKTTMAMLQWKADGPLRVQTALLAADGTQFVPAYYDPGAFPGIPRIPVTAETVPDHIRGVFPQSDRENVPAAVDVGDGRIRRLTIDPVGGPWGVGTDATPGRDHSQKYPPRNEGNYGQRRTIHLALTRSAGSSFDRAVVVVVPGGGTTYAVENRPDQPDDRAVALPRVGTSRVVAMPIVNAALAPGQTVALDYRYMDTPEASTPVHLVVVPYSGTA